jgi:hypothetical protein
MADCNRSIAGNDRFIANKCESITVLSGSIAVGDRSEIVRDRSFARLFQSVAARDVFIPALFRSKKSGDGSIANVFRSITVLFRSIASGDRFITRGDRSITSGDRFIAVLFRSKIVGDQSIVARHRSVTVGSRFIAFFFRSIARNRRLFTRGEPSFRGGRGRITVGEGLVARGGAFKKRGARSVSSPYLDSGGGCRSTGAGRRPWSPPVSYRPSPPASPRASARTAPDSSSTPCSLQAGCMAGIFGQRRPTSNVVRRLYHFGRKRFGPGSGLPLDGRRGLRPPTRQPTGMFGLTDNTQTLALDPSPCTATQLSGTVTSLVGTSVGSGRTEIV